MVSMRQWHFILGMLFFNLKGCMSVLTGPKALSGFLGRSLSVRCKYDAGFKKHVKYWCKGGPWSSCEIVVRTTASEEERTASRVFIKDDRFRLEFTVRLENLTQEDAGIYWCGIERTGSDYGVPVNITILPGPYSGLPIISNSTVSGPLGGSLSVICRYSEAYESYLKFWCKDLNYQCKKIIETTESSSLVKQDRFSINDNRSLCLFTIITENLTLEDIGQYRCGVNIPLGFEDYFPVTVVVLQEPLTTTVAAAAVTTRGPDSEPPGLFITILLPVIFLVLVVLLVAALLLMRSLKKQKAAKACGDILLSTAPNRAEGNTSERTEKPKQRPHHKTAPPSSHQATNHTEEVEYATVMKASTSASQPEVPTVTEQVSYASLSFQGPVEEATYANM
ncbi:CMRF35-like molecule 1 isoform X2 [Podarcis raffonei]|uniref:CMRF35-like molecule 1 isoform X2 n=1 Tax=Podarcis raffonei TaxID=65483 RepID=UPI0023297BD6|nr:CMRF35-like molecule 1 isoform X2 [Podarcis raffonei]